MAFRAQRVILAALVLAAAWLGAPAAEAASRIFRAEEIAQGHALRGRVMDRVPGLAEAVSPSAPAPLAPAAAADLLQRLGALGRAEADNPFYHWAMGEVRRRAGDAGAPGDFARARAAARAQPLLHWLLWEGYLERGQTPEADAELSALQQISLSWGLLQFPHLAERLVREARLALARGGYQEAAILLERSIDSDPSQAAPHFLMAKLLWQRGKGNVARALRFQAHGILLTWQSRWTRQILLGNFLADLIRALQLSLCVLAAVLVFRGHGLVTHDVRHRFRQRLTPAGQVALLLALLLPFALGLGIFWGALVILVLCAPYLSSRERVGVSVLMVSLCLLPGAYREVARDYLIAGSPKTVLAEEVEAGARGEESLAQVQQWAAETPGAYLPAYLLGLLHKRRGELGAAERELRRATELAPELAAPWVALGNVRYLQGDRDAAFEAYAKAVAPPASAALAHRNMAFIHLERLDFDRARQEFEEAFRLDPQLVSAVSSPRLARGGAFLADEQLGDVEFREALAPGGPQVVALAAAIGGWTLRRIPLGALPFAAGAGLLGFWGAARWGRRAAQARACDQCGKVFCPRCQISVAAERLCGACAAVMHLRQGIGASLKIQRRWDVGVFQEHRRRVVGILALCLPGAGHVYLGRPLGGLVLLLPALFLLSQLFVGMLFWRPLRLPLEMSWLLGAITVVPLFLILCTISALRCLRLTVVEGD